jgi:hypothetical protein
MRLVLTAILMGGFLGAQQVSNSTTSTTDLNGQRVPGPDILEKKYKNGLERVEIRQSINGRMVPAEQVEEHVIRDDASGRVVERVRRRFDPNGNPGPSEKTVIEEVKGTNGASTIRQTTYRGDINGGMQLAERSLTEVHKTGGDETTETVVERRTINDSFEPVEKDEIVQTKTGDGYQRTTVIQRKGTDGFYDAQRDVTEHSERNGQATDNTSEYEVGSSGSLALHSQTVAHSTKRADGSQISEVDIFGKAVPGTIGASDSGLKLQERDVVERRPSGSGSVEIVSAQRPTISDPGVLGPIQVISQKTCTGACQ